MPAKPNPEDLKKEDAMLAGVDWEVDESPLPILDRSTLEDWAACPLMASLKPTATPSEVPTSGQLVHDAISMTTIDYLDADGDLPPGELADRLRYNLQETRPDLQPDVLKSGSPFAWAWAKWLSGIHPGNILRFDGGDGHGRSGQLAVDLAGVRLTSELDFLHAGPSRQVVHEVDYKTGHKHWTAADVSESFQFCLHAVLVFEAYPEVEALEVTVWNTRLNNRTYPVEWKRAWLGGYRSRLQTAVVTYMQQKSLPKPEAWPTLEKCSLCEVADRCDVHGPDVLATAAEAEAALKAYIATDAKLTVLSKALANYVDKAGSDLVVGKVAFGRNKPAADRKKPAALYSLTKSKEE